MTWMMAAAVMVVTMVCNVRKSPLEHCESQIKCDWIKFNTAFLFLSLLIQPLLLVRSLTLQEILLMVHAH